MERQRTEFAAAVEAVLQAHGLNKRSQRIRTGIDHVTMGSIIEHGTKPQMETVLKFVRGFGLDEAEWLRKAGYEVPFDPDREFMRHCRALEAKGYHVIVDSREVDLKKLATPADVEAAIARVRTRAGCTCPP